MAIGIVVLFHFTISKADYAGVLYSRNMIVGLFAATWLIALGRRWWTPRRAPWAALAVGVLVGLAIQTLFVSSIAALGVWLLAWSSTDVLDDETAWRRSRRTLVITPVVVFATAPLYYAVRGVFAEFWDGYWIYNTFQNAATGRTLAGQLVFGRDAILRYYRAWPASLLIVVAFVVLTAALWAGFDRRTRCLHVAVAVWFVGAWAELITGQRYSSHYFSVLAVPTAMMAALVAGHLYRLLRTARGEREFRSVVAWPLVASLLAIAAWGGKGLTTGLQEASRFRSVSDLAAQRRAAEPGQQRTVRAVLDVFSTADDPLLAWTDYPWVYLNYHRTSATRFVWKTFLVGEVYLGRSSADYVLDRTWGWFAHDMAQTNPGVFLAETALPVDGETPFAAYVAANFQPVFADEQNVVYARNDLAAAMAAGATGGATLTPRAVAVGTPWLTGAGWATRAGDAPADAIDALVLSDQRCVQVSGMLAADPERHFPLDGEGAGGQSPHDATRDDASAGDATGADGAANPNGGSYISFHVEDPAGRGADLQMSITPDRAISGDAGTVFDSIPLPSVEQDPTNTDAGAQPFTIVVGERAAVLVIGGQIRAAVRLDGQSRLSVEVREGGVRLYDLRLAPAPPSAC
ncbi:MAG TPA: hypothetical protein PLV68_11820 [Ilumatobacteraceae bacterium]|nr:hypothetical protein [Ilumatobacteraceae bacterium]